MGHPKLKPSQYHMSYSEIGKRMNLSPNQVKEIANGALLKLTARRINLGLRSEDFLRD
ncbi:MAG: sigma-70 family RNA polymerase sigma factor [Deltaproteobacteria bacterium]|nr:sigma-70 family RNA polymerase sigma factor [Deltaproteobacteria bacterium]